MATNVLAYPHRRQPPDYTDRNAATLVTLSSVCHRHRLGNSHSPSSAQYVVASGDGFSDREWIAADVQAAIEPSIEG